MFLKLFFVSLLTASLSYAQTSAQADLKKVQDQIKALEAQKKEWAKIQKDTSKFVADVQKKCDFSTLTDQKQTMKCRGMVDTPLGAYSGYATRLNESRDELSRIDGELTRLRAAVPAAETAVATALRAELVDTTQVSRLLAMDYSAALADMHNKSVTLKNLRQQLDNSMLGDYVKFAFDKQAKTPQFKKSICETVSTCEQIKKDRTETAAKMQSFQQFMQERQREATGAGAAPAAAEGPDATAR